MKTAILALLALALICLAAGCGPRGSETELVAGSASTAQTRQGEEASGDATTAQSPSAPPDEPSDSASARPPVEDAPLPDTFEERIVRTIQATITMENGDAIILELYPDLAPQSVRNFVSLAREGFYDGLKFHRIIEDFMIQGGCPLGTGTGNPGYSIKGEFELNGFSNELSHKRGVISMARSDSYDSAGSQFFIVHGDSEFLDGGYAAFGKVTGGMDIVDKLALTPVFGGNGEVAEKDKPVIKSITIDDDIELPEPEKLMG